LRETVQAGFLRFTPAGAHCILTRWSLAAQSRNLAR
jgi:hypothetical protein